MHFLTVNGESAKQRVIPAQRHSKCTAGSAELDEDTPRWALIRGFVSYIGKMSKALTALYSIERRTGLRTHRGAQCLGKRSGDTAQRHCVEALSIVSEQRTVCRFAEGCRLFQHCIEHRRELAGRRVDDAQAWLVAACCANASSRSAVRSATRCCASASWRCRSA